jgi:plasmid stabilization system protein ParE
MRRVKWLRKALRNIQQIYDYIAETDAEAAAKVVLKIQTGVEQLEQFPMLGYGGRVQGTRELAIRPHALLCGLSSAGQYGSCFAGAASLQAVPKLMDLEPWFSEQRSDCSGLHRLMH